MSSEQARLERMKLDRNRRHWDAPKLTVLTFSETMAMGNNLRASDGPPTYQPGSIPLGASPLSPPSASSDGRLKRDIVPVGRLANGLTLYRYRYLWSEIQYVGVIAQEVAAVVPEAVITGPNGYLRVNYARLGHRLMTFAEWSGRSASKDRVLAA